MTCEHSDFPGACPVASCNPAGQGHPFADDFTPPVRPLRRWCVVEHAGQCCTCGDAVLPGDAVLIGAAGPQHTCHVAHQVAA